MPTQSIQRVSELLIHYWLGTPELDVSTRDICQRLTAWFEKNGHGGLASGVRGGQAPDRARIGRALEAARADFSLRTLISRLEPPAAAEHSLPRGGTPLILPEGSHQFFIGQSTHHHHPPPSRETRSSLEPEAPEHFKILLVTAAPSKMLEKIDPGQEAAQIAEALEVAISQKRVVLDQCPAATYEKLQSRLLLAPTPRYVHLAGHCDSEGAFYLMPSGRESLRPVSGAVFEDLFDIVKGVECLVLSACHSAKQLDVVSRKVRYAIGMRLPVDDGFVSIFSKAFYGAVAAGYNARDAFRWGCNRIRAVAIPGNTEAHRVPVLYEEGRQTL